MPSYYKLNTAEQLKHFNEEVMRRRLAGLDVTAKFESAQTNHNWTQFRAMHFWFEMIAEYLNGAGLDQRAILKADAEIPWTSYAVKEQLWRPVQMALTGKESTKDISGKESGDISEAIIRHMANKGVELPIWPHEERL